MPKIDVRGAVSAAVEYLKYIQDLIGNKLENLRLEEAELSEDRHLWLITLGFDIPVTESPSALEAAFSNPLTRTQKYHREYKVFTVNSETGEVEAMRIRET